MLRGESTHIWHRAEAVAMALSKGQRRIEPGKRKLLETRAAVERGWHAVSEILAGHGRKDLAVHVGHFVGRLPLARTENEQMTMQLLDQARLRRIERGGAAR